MHKSIKTRLFTFGGLLGVDIGKMEAKKQKATLDPRLQFLNSLSTTDLMTKSAIVVSSNGTGRRKTLW